MFVFVMPLIFVGIFKRITGMYTLNQTQRKIVFF